MASAALAARQQEFMAQILDDERALPGGWTPRHAAGMEIYRNAYRARLVDALRDTYERTAAYVGEDAFRQAAAHHVITHPPQSWTLDAAGDGFPNTLAELFVEDPEVAELGWLEWAMHEAFVAADATVMDAAAFGDATSLFKEEDWAAMRLTFLPGTVQRAVAHDIGKLWRAINDGDTETVEYRLEEALALVVWRENLKPVFMQVDAAEGHAMGMMLSRASYGDMCAELVDMLGEEQAVAKAGEMLGRWLHNGLIAAVSKS